MNSFIFLLNLTVIILFQTVSSEGNLKRGAPACHIDIANPPSTAPLVVDGNYNFPPQDQFYPNERGAFFEFGGVYYLACPGGELKPHGFDLNGQGVVCRGGSAFTVFATPTFYFENVSCVLSNATLPNIIEIHDNPDIHCEDDNALPVEVGYLVDRNLARVYTACFNYKQLYTQYVKYNVTRWVRTLQNYRKTPSAYYFLYDYFHYDMDSIYNNIATQFQSMGLGNYITTSHFLKKGQLAANEDFLYQFQRDATFHYVNVAPQWNTFDEGNWKVLEDGIANLLNGGDHGQYATVLTGTLKTATLKNSSGVSVELTLTGSLPVPRWFWKAVYFSDSNFGALFFGYNNPYDNKFDVDQEYLTQICYTDVFATLQSSWLLSDIDNSKAFLGYIYACPLNTVQIIDSLIKKIVSNVLSQSGKDNPNLLP